MFHRFQSWRLLLHPLQRFQYSTKEAGHRLQRLLTKMPLAMQLSFRSVETLAHTEYRLPRSKYQALMFRSR
jgi:hypothetical protein